MTKLTITLASAALMLGLFGCDGTVGLEQVEPHILKDLITGERVALYDVASHRYLLENGESVCANVVNKLLTGNMELVPVDEQGRPQDPLPPQEDGSDPRGSSDDGRRNTEPPELKIDPSKGGGKLGKYVGPNEGWVKPGEPGNPPLEECPGRLSLCDGRCVDLEADADNCGQCDNSCATPTCVKGRCVSEPAPGQPYSD